MSDRHMQPERRILLGLAYRLLGILWTAALPLMALAAALGILAYMDKEIRAVLMLQRQPAVFHLVLFGTMAPGFVGLLYQSWRAGGRYLYDWGVRLGTSAGERASMLNPILYLRSFATEDLISETEQTLASILKRVAPLIAIGRPGEPAPQLGSQRFYVGDDWQEAVREVMGRSLLVIVVAGKTPGLGWELDQCRKAIDGSRLLIVVPRDLDEYEPFRANFRDVFGTDLPQLSPETFERPFKFQPAYRMHTGLLNAPGIRAIVSFDALWQAKLHEVWSGSIEDLKEDWDRMLLKALRQALQVSCNGVLAHDLKLPTRSFARRIVDISDWTDKVFRATVRVLQLGFYGALVIAFLVWQGRMLGKNFYDWLLQVWPGLG